MDDLADQTANDSGQLILIAIETGDHRCQHLFGIEFLKVEPMAGMVGQQSEEAQLRPAIAFTESVNRIQLSQEVRRFI